MVETTAYQPDPNVGTGRTFDAGYMTAGLTYARSFTDKFSAGVTTNFIHEGLDNLTAIIDVFSRRIVGWSMNAVLNIGLALEALQTAIALRGRGRGGRTCLAGPP